jgi:undecaprenyl-diphosphatase
MMMELLRGILLGAVQGVTEFFPVSSSGHLILIPALAGWEDQGLLFDTVLHLGTLTALLWVFRTDIRDVFTGTFRRKDASDKRFLSMVIVASLPGIAFGGLFGGWIEEHMRGTTPVIFGLLVWGLMLLIADRVVAARKRSLSDIKRMTWTQALIVGFAQAIALFPGTSRSGITMTGGLFSGLDRPAAVRFSFLVSIPTIAAAGSYGIYKLALRGLDAAGTAELVVGFVAAALAGAWAIRFLRSYVETHSFTPFVIYRFALAVIVILLV